MPKNLTKQDIEKIDLTESEYFQNVVYQAIQRKNRSNNPYWVSIMSNLDVNATLAQSEITVGNLEEYKTEELAKVLGVDAVVAVQVNKRRYMSEEASAIINVWETILEALTDGPIGLPNQVDRTHYIRVDMQIIDVDSNTSIYERNFSGNIDFRSTPEDAAIWLSRRMGKKFPYREFNI